MKEQISIDDVVAFFNEMLELDSGVTNSLINNRTKCNDKFTDHPTIQVQQRVEDPSPKVGILGIINGIFGINEHGFGPICCEVDENNKIIKFKRTGLTTINF